MAAQENNEAERKLQKSYFDVPGLCCSSEVPVIENILKSVDGVKEYSVIVPTRTVIVVHDNLLVSQLQIVQALNQASLEANVRAYGDTTSYQKKWPSPFAVASGVLLLLSFLKYAFHPLRWLALGAVAAGVLPILLRAVVSVRNFRLDTNILVLIAVMGTIAMKDYLEAGTIVFLFNIAEWLESRAGHKATAVMTSLLSIAPQKAVIAETGEEVDVDGVELGTALAIKAGDVIPIDGTVVDGTCEVDEKTLTGESFPVSKQKDSAVWAGTINLNGYISVKTTALAEDSVAAKVANLVEEAQNSKSRTQRFIDKCAQYYTPAIILASVSLVVVPLALGVHNRSHWFYIALVVLVSACPCALLLSTPVATFCALTKAARAGLLIKGGDYLETLAKIKVMAFDKTGTITRGEFSVTDFQSLYEDISSETLLYWVSSIETKSSHPMAAALVDFARSLSIEPKPENVEDFQNFPGEGIHGKIDGKAIYIGNRKISLRAGSETVPTHDGDTREGKTIGYIYLGATPAGIFSLSDACRTGAAEAIKELNLLGIKSAMLTGDSQAAAMHAQEQLGHALHAIHAELLPEDKGRIIKEFKNEGPTAMIGDGVNDAPALATADIGISMGISGATLATETGNVILMSNDIRKVPEAIKLARKANRKVTENVIMSISTKSAILALAFAGHPLVWAAVLADVGTCLLVIFNSMLLLRQTDRPSAAAHNHKHGNEHSSHNGKRCCSNQKQENTGREAQKSQKCATECQSSHQAVNFCRKNECCDSIKPPLFCPEETQHMVFSDQSRHCCSYSHNSSSLAGEKCKSSAVVLGECKCRGGLHEAQHCHNRHSHLDQSTDLEEGLKMTKIIRRAFNAQTSHCCSDSHNSRSLAGEKCKSSAAVLGECKNRGGLHEAQHCHNRHSHLDQSTDLEEGLKTTKIIGHCHTSHCGNDMVKISVKDDTAGNIIEGSSNYWHQAPELNPDLKKCCTGNNCNKSYRESPCTDARSLAGTEYIETRTTANECMSLRKREFGGCCRSYYLNKCFGKHGSFESSFSIGGLSEIISE